MAKDGEQWHETPAFGVSVTRNSSMTFKLPLEAGETEVLSELLKKYISDNKKDFFELKKKLIEEIVRFIVERLKVYLKDQEQVRQDVLNVVMNAYLESLESHKSVDILYLSSKINKPGVAIILGNEVEGVLQSTIDVCDACVEIEQYGTKHSLNVAISGGIAIWELFKALKH